MHRSRLEDREPVWWATLAAWCDKQRIALDSVAYDTLFEIICDAIQEDGAIEAASRGGLKGGKALAARLTPRQRSASARRAANARWADYQKRAQQTRGGGKDAPST